MRIVIPGFEDGLPDQGYRLYRGTGFETTGLPKNTPTGGKTKSSHTGSLKPINHRTYPPLYGAPATTARGQNKKE
jgi:hypothetical protein